MKKNIISTIFLTCITLHAQKNFILKEVKKTPISESYFFYNQKTKRNFKIVIEKGDITQKNTQAIVSAANEAIWMPSLGGVAKAIIDKAGNKKIEQYVCAHFPQDKKGIRCKTGSACTTPAFALEKQGIKKIIHAVGPRCNNAQRSMNTQEKKLLKDAYSVSLQQADAHNLTSISFPFISSAIFACNKNDAAQLALQTARKYLEKYIATTIQEVYFVLFTEEDFKIFITQAEKLYK